MTDEQTDKRLVENRDEEDPEKWKNEEKGVFDGQPRIYSKKTSSDDKPEEVFDG